jgi:DNA polymerase III epsilon subunit family exonuclease
MEELELISRQAPGTVSLVNFEELKQQLEKQMAVYKGITYSDAAIKDARSDRASLNKLKSAIDDKRKEIKKQILAPYEIVDKQAKELLALIDEPLQFIAAYIREVDDRAKAEKYAEIKRFYLARAAALGDLAEAVFDAPGFYCASWENSGTSAKQYQDEILCKIDTAARDLNSIKATGGMYTPALVSRYMETFSMDSVIAYRRSLETVSAQTDASAGAVGDGNNVVGYMVLKISGTENQMLQILDQMRLLGMDVDEVEDGMPKPMTELKTPDFDAFVAFDIETTGTFGAANGDAPPEITEIGAVKVAGGKIVERFSELANPGRRITPQIARLTRITDEMVADKPPIADVIRRFKAFAGDSVLVGHNIKSYDIPYIVKAAKKAGVAFGNDFFDTYRFAKPLKERNGWDNVKLETLARHFCIAQPDAHRAWCDAEANAGVYFKLREL